MSHQKFKKKYIYKYIYIILAIINIMIFWSQIFIPSALTSQKELELILELDLCSLHPHELSGFVLEVSPAYQLKVCSLESKLQTLPLNFRFSIYIFIYLLSQPMWGPCATSWGYSTEQDRLHPCLHRTYILAQNTHIK